MNYLINPILNVDDETYIFLELYIYIYSSTIECTYPIINVIDSAKV